MISCLQEEWDVISSWNLQMTHTHPFVCQNFIFLPLSVDKGMDEVCSFSCYFSSSSCPWTQHFLSSPRHRLLYFWVIKTACPIILDGFSLNSPVFNLFLFHFQLLPFYLPLSLNGCFQSVVEWKTRELNQEASVELEHMGSVVHQGL